MQWYQMETKYVVSIWKHKNLGMRDDISSNFFLKLLSIQFVVVTVFTHPPDRPSANSE